MLLLARLHYVLPLIAVAGDATAAVADRWSPLINLGAIGCVLLWFLLRAEPRMRAIEDAIDRSSRATMLAVISMRDVPQAVKDQAQSIINEIESKSKP